MVRGARMIAWTCAAACSAGTQARLPARVPEPVGDGADAALPVAAAPPACITAPDTVSFLYADAHAVWACFALRDGHPDECVTIDRRSSQISRDPSPPPAPLQIAHRAAGPGRIAATDKNDETICEADRCMTVPIWSGIPRDDFALGVSEDGRYAVVTTLPSVWHPEVRFAIMAPHVRMTSWFEISNTDPCGSGVILDDAALVETDDCHGTGQAFVAGDDGAPAAPLVDRLDFNAFGAWPVDLGGHRWGVVAPAEYAVVLFDTPGLSNRTIVDLVPIQAESTPTPSFVERHGGDSTWVIASPTGGVGIIDPTRAVLANAWIIPRCSSP